jgi:hypothetical protein
LDAATLVEVVVQWVASVEVATHEAASHITRGERWRRIEAVVEEGIDAEVDAVRAIEDEVQP